MKLTEQFRILSNQEFPTLYRSFSIAKTVKHSKLRGVGNVAIRTENTEIFKGNLLGKRPLGRPKWRREDRIKILN